MTTAFLSMPSAYLVAPERAVLVIHENGIRVDLGKAPASIDYYNACLLERACEFLSSMQRAKPKEAQR